MPKYKYIYKMKQPLPYILILLLLGACVYMFFDRPSGHDQEMQRLLIENQRIRIEKDSAKALAEHWRLTSLEYGNQYRKEATRAMKAEQNLNYLREQNEILKKRPVVRYSEQRLDSVFARYN